MTDILEEPGDRGDMYTGFWTNWEDGNVQGSTLTLPTYQGLVLVSFLTLFVQFSGVCFWRVLCFILHQARSKPTLRDGLYHQHQAILRNAVTAPSALWNFVLSAFKWRGRARTPLRSALPLAAIALVHIGLFAIAGLFSSRVTKSASAGQVLLRGEKCGYPNELVNMRLADPMRMHGDELDTFNTQALLGRYSLSKAFAYVRSCYDHNGGNSAGGCDFYVQPFLGGLDSSAVNNASCPFTKDACATSTAVRYDSGKIRSNEDLGINYPISDGLTFRRVTSCAPIRANKYATDWRDGLTNEEESEEEEKLDGSEAKFKFYEFGNSDSGCEETAGTTNLTTFCVADYMKKYIREAYTLRAQTSYYNNESASEFDPIPDFQVDNADVTLISIFSKAHYNGLVKDPLFFAETPSEWDATFYTSAEELVVLGCAEQYQVCNSGSGECTELTGLYGIFQEAWDHKLAMNPKQVATFEVIWKAAWAMSFQWSLKVLATEVLLAKDWVYAVGNIGSTALPDNQWELESRNLHNLSLATLQRRVQEFSNPSSFMIRPGVDSLSRINKPKDPALADLCYLQKVRSGDHYSVSVLGMSIILGVGGLFMLLDWILIQQVFWLRNYRHKRLSKTQDWMDTGLLQLHRRAMEARGVGPWDSRDFEFPVLMEGKKLFPGLGTQYGSVGENGDEYVSQTHTTNTKTAYEGGSYSSVSQMQPTKDNK